MSRLDAITSFFRPQRPDLAEAPSSVETPVLASVAAEEVATTETEGTIPPVELTEESSPGGEDQGPTPREASAMLHLSNVSHGVNHFQHQMMTMLYPSIMTEFGMTNLEIGVLAATRAVINTTAQGASGFLTPFVSRCKILGIGNFLIAVGTFLSGISFNFPMLVFARCVAAVGSSPQHPVGFSILASYFPKRRGAIIALNNSASNVGTLVATPLATMLLLVMGWRDIFFMVAFASIIMGIIYFLFRDYGNLNRVGSGRSRLGQGFRSYGRVLRNKNMVLIALVFMVGAAGAEGGINNTYFAPHLANDFGYGVFIVGLLITAINIGQIAGPVIFGWLSDRMSRVAVLQSSLVMSALGTLWVAWQGPGEVVLFIGLMIYSAVTSSRGTLTQAIIADTASDEDRDAAFSLYFFLGFFAQPFWILITGFLMDQAGWGVAVSRLSVSYVVAAVLLFFVVDVRRKPEAATAA